MAMSAVPTLTLTAIASHVRRACSSALCAALEWMISPTARAIERCTCPRCKREVEAMDRWIMWHERLWHLQCLASVRGWTVVELDPGEEE